MSDHKKPMPPELRDALANHRLPTDMPSQLADSFRHGWYAGREDAQAEIARLRGALESIRSITTDNCAWSIASRALGEEI